MQHTLEPFRPAPGLRNPHLQSLLNSSALRGAVVRRRARDLLADWRRYLPMFWKVAPKFAITEEGAMTVVERHLRAVRRMRARAAAAR